MLCALLEAQAGARGYRREHDGLGTPPTAHRAWSHSGSAAQGHPVEDTSTWLLEYPWVAWRESERAL